MYATLGAGMMAMFAMCAAFCGGIGVVALCVHGHWIYAGLALVATAAVTFLCAREEYRHGKALDKLFERDTD